MSDRLQELTLFVRVAETGSFSRAGRELGLAQPTVSRIIVGLEERLGVKLLLRTTRKVTVTEAGALLHDRARALLAEVEEVEQMVRGTAGVSGTLRVATPVTFGAREISPRMGEFLAAYPDLRVELLMADRRVDLLDEGVDLAIRMGTLDDSTFTSRRIATAPRHVIASPAYLARHGAPLTPQDLLGHSIILGQSPGTAIWVLTRPGGREVSLKLHARLVATSMEGVMAAVVAGLGLAAVSSFACGLERARGEVVTVLDDHTLPTIDVHAVLPAGRRPPAKARLFIDHLAAGLARAAQAGDSQDPASEFGT